MLAWKRISIRATAREIPLTNLSIELTRYLSQVSRWLFAWTSVLRPFSFRGLVIAWWSTRARCTYVCATDPLHGATYALSKRRNRAAVNEATIWWIEPRNARYSIRECRFFAKKKKKRTRGKKNYYSLFSSRFFTRATRSIERTELKRVLCELWPISIDLFDSVFSFFFFSLFENTRAINRAISDKWRGMDLQCASSCFFELELFFFFFLTRAHKERLLLSRARFPNLITSGFLLSSFSSKLSQWKILFQSRCRLVRSSTVVHRRRFIISCLKFFGNNGFLKDIR